MLRFGIMGAGGIAHSFREAIMATPEQAQLVAVASKSMDRAKKWISDGGIHEDEIHCYGDYESFLQDETIDVVYIATTVNYHYENIKQCLEAGKHVLCEKSMVETEEKARELFALAKEKGLFLMEAMWSRFMPRAAVIREWIQSGKIGKIKTMSSSIGFVAPKDLQGRLYNKALGGGAMYDIGIYIIDMLSYLADKEIIDTKAKIQWSESGVDENIWLSMEFEDDIMADGFITFDAIVTEDAYIYGTEGYIRVPKIHWGRDAYLYGFGDELKDSYESPEIPGFVYEIKEVVQCIEAGKLTSEIASPEMTYASCRIFDRHLR